MNKKEYIDGMDTNQFTIIKEISHYNHNYYIGLDGDLLFAESDDDNTTNWFVADGSEFIYLGESYTSRGDKLRRHEKYQL